MTPLALQLAALDEDKVTPGLLGFTVVAILAVATWVLLRSMTKRLKRVNFEERDIRGGGGGDGPGGDRVGDSDGTRGPAAAGSVRGADDQADGEPGHVEGGGADTAEPADAAGDRETQGNGAR
ncbi:hypothetical protein [Yinghuangia sp. YIM S10712]|uniref:hypothetical protein n=1 Tax=Yinghuangia sp. YIM S10712 TaxID=3436930 RepID=UPI003F53856C